MITLILFSILFFVCGLVLAVVSKRLTLKFVGILLISIGFVFFFAYASLKSYSFLVNEDLIAKVRCYRTKGQLYDMALKYTPVVNGITKEEEVYLLKGEQWMIDGDILKWRPVLNILGFKTGYKVTRISGRFLTVSQSQYGFQTSYTIGGGSDRLWLFLHKYQKCLPFVEAVYGNGAYTFADDNKTFGVYVTTSGFIIKEYDGK